MERPYIICHMLSALDGRITGKFMRTEKASQAAGEYARIRSGYNADAWLYGTVTTKEFTNGRKPALEKVDDIPSGDHIAGTDAEHYYISVDTAGEIGWESSVYRKAGRPDAHVIEVLTENTPIEYKAYLRKQGVSYIIAGDDALDCRIAVEKLYSLFGVRKLLICGGGVVNWSFLQAGVIDELSLLVAPVADGDPSTVTLFEKSELLPEHAPVIFRLKNIEKLENDCIRLIYTTCRS